MDNNTYWDEKNKNTEFNILISQAVNLANDDIIATYNRGEKPRLTLENSAKDFFTLLLDLRADKELRKKFDDYFTKKNEKPLVGTFKVETVKPKAVKCPDCDMYCKATDKKCPRCGQAGNRDGMREVQE